MRKWKLGGLSRNIKIASRGSGWITPWTIRNYDWDANHPIAWKMTPTQLLYRLRRLDVVAEDTNFIGYSNISKQMT